MGAGAASVLIPVGKECPDPTAVLGTWRDLAAQDRVHWTFRPAPDTWIAYHIECFRARRSVLLQVPSVPTVEHPPWRLFLGSAGHCLPCASQ